MSRLFLSISFCLLVVCSACSRSESSAEARSAPTSQDPPGVVTIPPDSPKLRQVRVEPVGTALIPEEEVVSPGKIEVNPHRVARVVLPVPGRIASVLVRLGDAVAQGQPLLTIESPDADAAESAYLQAQAGVSQAKANLLKAQADLDRTRDLFEHSAVAKKEVLNAENALAQAQAAGEQAQAAVEQGSRKLAILGLKPGTFGQKVVLTSPLSGKVLDVSTSPGEYRNDTNAPLMTVADLSSVWVASDVPETQIRLIEVGEHVDVTLSAYPGEVFRGRVTRIADTEDPQTRTIKVRAEMDNPRGRLRPEMFGSIRHTEGLHQAVVLPAGAVIQGDGTSVVFVEREPGRFQQTEVKTGKRAGDWLPVLAGVKTGDRVVVDGAMLLKTQ